MKGKLSCVLVMVTIVVSTVNSDNNNYDKSADSNGQLSVLDGDDDLTYSESVRNVRLIDDSEQWRGLQRIQTEDDRPFETRPQKRRRLRKRKRRPKPLGADEQSEIVRPRRRRPIRLDELEQADDGWKEMEAESPHQAYSRRRKGPVYQEDSATTQTFTVAATTTTTMKTTTEHTTPLKDIKDILKQTGGLSLSEILLQKNLTLSDLLSGSHNAILALSERPVQIVTEKQSAPVVADVISTEAAPEAKMKEEQRVRISQLYNQESKLYNDITTKYEVITEATTEKRIFVPSHPKYYTSVNFKPEFDLVTEAPKRTTLKLPMTSAQMNMKIKKPTETQTVEKPAQTTKGPLKMSFDLEELSKQNAIFLAEDIKEIREPTTETIVTTTPMTTTTTSTTTTTAQAPEETIAMMIDKPTSEKLTTTQRFFKKQPTMATPILEPKQISVSAKDEIMEIIANRDIKEELAKILTSRNMTIDQLVEQRERGSSQRHLAEIFHNNTKEPEPSQVVEEVQTQPFNNRRPKVMSTTSTPTTTSTTTTTTTTTEPTTLANNLNPDKPLEDVSMSSEEITLAQRLPSTSFPTYKISTNKISKEIPPLHIPIWKTIYPSIYIESEHIGKKLELDAIEQSIRQAVDDDLNEISRSNNNLNEYDDYIQLPIGVKSAIFASLAIVGMSLVLFLTILVVFRWSQKHKKRLCYGSASGSASSGSTFTCSKIKSPILQQHEPKRTIRTFVSETLGKRRNFYAQHFRQSMSDSWESNERPYQ